jgi:hypothetical protein
MFELTVRIISQDKIESSPQGAVTDIPADHDVRYDM